ncbi:MAG: prolyl oligopeptidase family serine peptidase [Actinomycetota bacterium]
MPRAAAWVRPEMAWTSSRVLGLDAVPGTAVQQPRHSPRFDAFGWVSDENGVANVVIEADGIVGERTVIEDDCEHGGPTWGPGQRTWCFSPDATKVAYTRNESGFGSLWVHDRLTGERTQVARSVHGCLSWEGDRICALRTGARTPDQVVVYDVADLSSPSRVFTRHFTDATWASEHDVHLVEPVTGSAGGVPYRLYEPAVPAGGLIVWVHGGPTDQWQVTWRPRFSYWLSRGWSIAVSDPRGSTGHGRAHMLELEGAWGAADADDTAAVARDVQARTGIDRTRTVLMGGSAGGLAVLSAANRHDGIAACVVAAYPVVDLALLLESEDPFEGHYNRVLVGDVTLSPNMDVRHLRAVPVLLFHGSNDMLVVPEHSFRLRDAVTSAGGSVRVEIMEGEGHGFRDPHNVRRELEMTEEFVRGVTRAG